MLIIAGLVRKSDMMCANNGGKRPGRGEETLKEKLSADDYGELTAFLKKAIT